MGSNHHCYIPRLNSLVISFTKILTINIQPNEHIITIANLVESKGEDTSRISRDFFDEVEPVSKATEGLC